MRKKQQTKRSAGLSPQAKRVLELVEIIGEGSQRMFARRVGCSHTLISKIAMGQQEPGRTLTRSILALKDVDKEWFLKGAGQPPSTKTDDVFHVPVADALLPGPPSAHRSMLTSWFEPVPKALYGSGVYAVLAGRCEPAFGDPDEKLRNDDRIIIDASSHRWRENLQSLDGKLCAVVVNDLEREVVTLRRVWLPLDAKTGSRRLMTVLDRSLESYRELQEQMKHELEKYRKYLRDIEPRTGAEIPASESLYDEIPATLIVGVAIQLVRAL